MRTSVAAVALAAGVALTGCSQVAQLQPVAGGQVTAVRTATNDVLVDRGVQIGIAPLCELQDPLYVCNGTTDDGQDIRSEAEVLAKFGATTTPYGADSPADVSLVVTIEGNVIFTGKVEDVLEKNAREAR